MFIDKMTDMRLKFRILIDLKSISSAYSGRLPLAPLGFSFVFSLIRCRLARSRV